MNLFTVNREGEMVSLCARESSREERLGVWVSTAWLCGCGERLGVWVSTVWLCGCGERMGVLVTFVWLCGLW